MKAWRQDGDLGATHVAEAESEADDARLARRAAVLAALRHPGIVEGLGCSVASGGVRQLRTRWVGPNLTGLGRALESAEIAGLGAAAATTLADLHALGWVHRSVVPEHVVVDPDGRPVLCGMGAALQSDDAAARTADIRALVATLQGLVPLGTEAKPLRRALQGSGRAARDAAALARRLADPSLVPRLPRLGYAQPGSDPPPAKVEPAGEVAPAGEVTGGRGAGLRRRTSAAGVAVGAVMVVSACVFVGRPAGGATSCPPVDGRCRPVPAPGGVLTTPFGRYGIGSPGDTVVLGRWDCGPMALPALLHRATSEIWVFDRWPEAGADVAARFVARVRGAVSLTVVPLRSGCDGVRVIRAGAAAVGVTPGPR